MTPKVLRHPYSTTDQRGAQTSRAAGPLPYSAASATIAHATDWQCIFSSGNVADDTEDLSTRPLGDEVAELQSSAR